MGNCQAIDAATLVIQHPNGKTERFYSPVTATHVMKTNPGHYVALIISTTTLCSSSSSKTNNTSIKDNNNIANFPKENENNNKGNSINPVRITRIKLLKPTDTLQLGQVYRLITTQEVMKGLKERKKSKIKQQNMSSEPSLKEDFVKEKQLGLELENAAKSSDSEDNQVTKHERHRTRTTTASSNNNNGGSVITAKTRFWQPSLQSISESAS